MRGRRERERERKKECQNVSCNYFQAAELIYSIKILFSKFSL